MMRTYIIESGQQPTEEQLREVEEAARKPIVFDDDCPEPSLAMLEALRLAAVQRNRNKNA